MWIAVFLLFVFVIAGALIYWQLQEPKEVEIQNSTIELARNFQEQLDLLESHHTLGKITDKEYEDLCREVNDRALQIAMEKLDGIEHDR